MRTIFLISFVLTANVALTQTLGGSTVFNFLRLSTTPQITALGGVNVSSVSNDIGLAFNNPGLLRPAMHAQMNAVFNDFYNGINAYNLTIGYHSAQLNTSFLWGLNFLSYGNTQETDASGNVLGSFNPTDWVMQVAASRSYLEKWRYGLTLKFISSNYGQYRSNGIAADVGVLYYDSSKALSASLVAKNMGTQLKTYDGTDPDDLPFDLQLGLSFRLKQAPFGFHITAHHLHQFDITYNDTVFNNANGFSNQSKGFTMDRLFRHFVLATDIYIGDRVQLTAGYNYLRRKELNTGSSGNGLNGFSIGVSLLLNKLQVKYARSQYQPNTAFNQLGLNLPLNKYFGLGKWGERIGW